MNPFEVLKKEINDKVTQLKDWIAAGQAKDYAEYLKVCGEIKGLLTTRQNILDLEQRLEHSDDE